MTDVYLSDTQREFILHGFQMNYRNDGRSLLDYRPIELETNIVTHANGSARLRLANSDILVCVKSEIDVPSVYEPDKGKIEIVVDCSANATPDFEGRGGEELANEISNTLKSAFKCGQSFDYKSLCLIPGQQCWKLFIDILILECGGNLFDAVSLAVKAALYNTKLPRLRVESLDAESQDLIITDNALDYTRVKIDCIPLLITIGMIDKYLILDPTSEEEESSRVLVVIGVCRNNNKDFITHVHTITEKCFDLTQFYKAIQLSFETFTRLDSALMNALKLEESNYNEFDKKEIVGFLQ